MKWICSLLLLLSVYTCVSAQQIDNNLLLDYYQNQKYTDAAKYLKSVYTEPVTDIKALGSLAYTSRMAGNLTDAEGYYLRLFEKDSTNTAVLFNLGNINVNRHNTIKALYYYKKILARDSLNFSVYKQLADLSQNDTLNYVKYLEKANAINPVEADVAYDLGYAYLQPLGKVGKKGMDKAAAVLTIALQADTSNLLLLKGKANVLYLQFNYPETIEACKKLIINDDKSTQVINWMAVSYFRLRQYKLCIEAYKMIPDEKQNEGIFFYTAMCYKALGDEQNAIVYYNKALADAISANTADYYNDLGDSYATLHQFKKSLASYQKSLEFKEIPLTYYSLANLYDVELKDKKSALKYYKKYLASKPDIKTEQKYIDYAKTQMPATEAK